MLAEARRLFAEGVAHTQAQRWSEAAASFRAALELHAAAPIRYNLAAALVELHEYPEALQQLDAVLADESAPASITALARALLERIRGEAAMLTIAVEGDRAGAVVALDAEPLEESWLARELPVPPGAHTVTAIRDEQTVAEAEVTARAGESARVRLLITAPGGSTTPASVPLYEDWRFWLGVGAGAAALITIVAIVAVAAQPGGSSPPVVGNFAPGVITW